MSSHTTKDIDGLKIFALSAILLVTGGVTLHNIMTTKTKIKTIDHGTSFVFNSVASCTAQKKDLKSCEESKNIAQSESDGLGTRIEYRFKSSCEKNHAKTCVYHYKRNNKSFYTPNMVAWQVSSSDFKVSVPLYATPDPALLWRSDKTTIPVSDIGSLRRPAPEGTF